MNYLPQLAARVINAPLMVERARLEMILSVIGPRIGLDGGMALPEVPNSSGPDSLAITPNGIAIIPIHGTLVKRAGSIDAASGLLSYAAIENMLLEAATDPAVGGILLDVDSPGGEVGGVFDLADLIREAREAKPVYALTDDAFSAAYLLASAADRIYLSQTGGVGSIGVIAVHVDESERDAKEGRHFTTVFAGAHKNDFSSHAPLSDTAKSRLQTEVDRIYGMFVGAVARSRGMSEQAVRATEAGLFFGENAVKAGLADQVGTLRDALSGLITRLETPQKTIIHAAAEPPVSAHEEKPMDPTEEKPVEKSATAGEVIPLPEKTATPQQSAPSGSGEVIDLEKVRAEKATQMREEANAIVELCALADRSDLAGEFIAKGTDLTAVRKELMALRASGEEIHSHLMPGDGTRLKPEGNMESNPVVNACQRMAQQHKGV